VLLFNYRRRHKQAKLMLKILLVISSVGPEITFIVFSIDRYFLM